MTCIHPLLLFVCLMAAVPPAAGQDAKTSASRTKDGHPDLQGVWNFSSGVPLQRPPAFVGRPFFTKEEFDSRRTAIWNALAATARFAPVEDVGFDWIDRKLYVKDLRTSLITYPDDGRLPALVEGVRRAPGQEDLLALLADAKGGLPPGLLDLVAAFGGGGRKDGHTDFNAFERCLDSPSLPLLPQIGENYVQIIQARDSVALVSDFDRRILSLDGRSPAAGTPRSRAGTSRGWWEGDTLVVNTANFNDRTPSFAGAGNSRDKAVTERFTRTSDRVMQYSATILDPKTFKDRIELSFPMARVDARIFEGACHEGNYSLANTLSAVRKEEEEARKIH
jgi:hypothetical protein